MSHDLQRFAEAQDPLIERVREELQRGAKTSHWMWFVFPQLRALGRSATARHYGIESLAEAQAYWCHPVLGPRLKDCASLVLAVDGKTAHEIFGSPDDLKLCSCMTLFERAAPQEPVFGQVLDKYYRGERDPRTLALLQGDGAH
ncbi:DUF1810 domain-containing protein [Piscinibacter sp. XHJ-5]|uniref:DUF1810 domain-containing protein n=1 Tax=Piscinibacter sp. XHJ-5 TaxID=3037797 RepID=UPI0024534392|nr:DUF1810 domain-containing protein [Piscinibacter sp. XHJ-5]